MTDRPPLRGRYAGAAGPRWPLAGAFLAALLVAFGVAYAVLQGSPLRSAEAVALAHLDAPVSGEARRVRVVVREGETAATIAQKLPLGRALARRR
ncbi:MAG: hypothetical protein HYU88_07915 [Chloroflexi bacterium]|nr:hypothetical protein [Chloroflexota bacterium]